MPRAEAATDPVLWSSPDGAGHPEVVVRRQQVLHICTRFLRGGSEQRLRDIVGALDGYEHHVVVGDDSDVELARRQLPEAEVRQERRLRRAPDPVNDLAALRELTRLIRQHRYGAVVTHQSKAGVLGRLAAWAAGGPPVVCSLSMANFGSGYGVVESALYRLIERALVRSTGAYAVVGTDLARRFQSIGVPAEKMSVIRSAVRLPTPHDDRRAVRQRLTDGLGLAAERPLILHLGSLENRKNALSLPVFLQHVLQLFGGPRPCLVIAGAGPLEEQLRSLVRRVGIGDDVRMLGYVQDPTDLLFGADAVILLSDAEGLPQSLVQAAGVGTPFVSTEVDGVDELLELGASGSVVPRRDVVGAARAVLPYLRWPVEDRRPTIDLSSWDRCRVVTQYADLFASVLGAGQPVT
jgi:glycosyltransferase involved in cell wall biosynthesis